MGVASRQAAGVGLAGLAVEEVGPHEGAVQDAGPQRAAERAGEQGGQKLLLVVEEDVPEGDPE